MLRLPDLALGSPSQIDEEECRQDEDFKDYAENTAYRAPTLFQAHLTPIDLGAILPCGFLRA